MLDLCMKSSPEITAVVLCAGKGQRAGLGYNKILHNVGGTTVAVRSIRKFLRFDRVIVVCSRDDEMNISAQMELEHANNVTFVRGGETRTESVRSALKSIGKTDIVIIHDGARPFVSDKTIDDSIESAIEFGSGVAVVKSVNAIKIKENGFVHSTNRDNVFVVQTPQTFRFEEIMHAYEVMEGSFADDSEVYERAGHRVHLVDGTSDNIKLTTPSDFMGLNSLYRLGYGFDVHAFKEGRRLVLCGVEIDHPLGLDGHSDADAPVHAIMDALLSATSLPDIGVLFPDTDPEFEGADSIELLRKVLKLTSNFEIINLSVCIITQKPKIAPHVEKMRNRLAEVLNISSECVNISATTSEFLGITGEGKGLASSADILIRKR